MPESEPSVYPASAVRQYAERIAALERENTRLREAAKRVLAEWEPCPHDDCTACEPLTALRNALVPEAPPKPWDVYRHHWGTLTPEQRQQLVEHIESSDPGK
jgi:hypothetical protein